MAKTNDISQLKNLEKLFNEAVEDLAHEVVFKIEGLYETAIDSFYADYSPLYYRRTYSTYLASSGYENTFSQKNLHKEGDIWNAGITVDPSNIPGKPYRAKDGAQWVFPRTFEKGIHGFNKDNKWGRKGKVYSKLKVKGNKIFTTIRMKGSDITNITNYYDNSTSFSYTSTTMQNMSPAPKTIMNKEFKKLTGKRNINKMFMNILNQKLNK